MDVLFELQEKVKKLVKAYKLQSLTLDAYKKKVSELESKIKDQEDTIAQLENNLTTWKTKTSLKDLDHVEKNDLKNQLSSLIGQIDIYLDQLK